MKSQFNNSDQKREMLSAPIQATEYQLQSNFVTHENTQASGNKPWGPWMDLFLYPCNTVNSLFQSSFRKSMKIGNETGRELV